MGAGNFNSKGRGPRRFAVALMAVLFSGDTCSFTRVKQNSCVMDSRGNKPKYVCMYAIQLRFLAVLYHQVMGTQHFWMSGID